MATLLTDLTETPGGNSLLAAKRLWHDSAPRRVAQKWSPDDVGASWNAWQQHLARRKQPPAVPFLRGSSPGLLWAWPEAWDRDELTACIASPVSTADEVAELRGAKSLPLPGAMRLLAAAYALPTLADQLPAGAWWQLTAALVAAAIEAEPLRVDWPGDAQEVLRQQLLAGELPLALSYALPELRPTRDLRKPARTALSEAVVELTDGEGAPHARLLPVLGPLWACWTRCRWLGEHLKRGCWSSAADSQYEWLVRHMLQLVDHRRHLLLATDDAAALPKGMFATALELAGDDGDCAAADALLPGSVLPDDGEFDDDDLPETSFGSEWSALAVLATEWSKTAPRLAISYADDPPQIALSVAGRPLLAGRWTASVTLDGRSVPVADEWEELCWQSDEDCDYLELGLDLECGLRIERQLLLAREDEVLYLADNLVGDLTSPRELELVSGLPLADGFRWLPEDETRDGVLADDKGQVAVLPLALSEWRSDPRGGSLICENNRLTLSQRSTGVALCCPLMFDLRPGRTKRERTWRQLTVAEALEVVPRDRAVAYRAQSGRDQWFIYRSLGRCANRTALGQNFTSEFFAGRFLKTGEVDEWIEIEEDGEE